MATALKPKTPQDEEQARLSHDHNVGQDSFQQIVDKEFSQREQARGNKRLSRNDPELDSLREREDSVAAPKADDLEEDEDKPSRWATNIAPPKNNGEQPNKRKPFFKRRSTIASTVVLFIFGLFGISVGTTVSQVGQLIHISQILSGAHFLDGEDNSDTAVMRIVRFIRYAPSGQLEKTRVGAVGGKIADVAVERFSQAGYDIDYTPDRLRFFNGFTIDPANPPRELRGKSPQQIQQYFEERGIRVTVSAGAGDLEGRILIETENLDGRSQRLISKYVAAQTKLGRVGSWMAYRAAAKQAGVPLHPFSLAKADRAVLEAVQSWLDANRERFKAWQQKFTRMVRAGVQAIRPTTENRAAQGEDGQPADPDGANTGDAADAIDEVSQEADEANQAEANGDSTARSKFIAALQNKFVQRSASVVGVLCIARAVVDQAVLDKKENFDEPAQRFSGYYMAAGAQAQSGHDFNLEEAGFAIEQLRAKDNASSWRDDPGMQAETGREQTGPDTVQALKDNPRDNFGFLYNPAVDAVCSVAAGILLGVIGLVGGPVSALVGFAAGLALGPLVISMLADLLLGTFDINAGGATAGGILNIGALRNANANCLALGCAPMTDEQVRQATMENRSILQEEFDRKSTFAKLFDITDYRSKVSQVIDSSTGDAVTNVARALSPASLLSFITPNAKATVSSDVYNYGIAKYGWPAEQLNNPEIANPQQLLDTGGVVELLEGPDGEAYIERARTCNGVDIRLDTQDRWGAFPMDEGADQTEAANNPDCNDQGIEWLKIRAFIMYSVSTESLACGLGDDSDPEIAESCAIVGFGTAQGAAPVADPVAPAGNAQAIAQQMLSNPNISFQTAERRAEFEQIAAKGTQTACGQEVPISPVLLSALQTASQSYKIVLGVFAAGHSCNNGYHPRGMAADINGVAKLDGSATTGNRIRFNENVELVREFYNFLPSVLPPNTGGLGEINCTSGLNRAPGVTYFDDACNHIHFDVRQN